MKKLRFHTIKILPDRDTFELILPDADMALCFGGTGIFRKPDEQPLFRDSISRVPLPETVKAPEKRFENRRNRKPDSWPESSWAGFMAENTFANTTNSAPIILIVEEGSELKDLLTDALGDRYDFLRSDSIANAWQMCQQLVPDLVVTDVNLVGGDGVGLCRKVKENERTSHLPVILVTKEFCDQTFSQALEARADHYLVKPLNSLEIRLRVHNLLVFRESMRRRFETEVAEKLVAPAPSMNDIDSVFLKKLVSIIDKNLTNNTFGVTELAKELAYSRAVLYKRVKLVTGKTINDFVKDIRITTAAKLLNMGRFRVNEVAEMVGFSDRRYFSKEFRKVYGKTPSEYIHRTGGLLNS